jgi:hypothetical protein
MIIHKKIAMFLQSLFFQRSAWFLLNDQMERFSFSEFDFNRNFSPLRASRISRHLLYCRAFAVKDHSFITCAPHPRQPRPLNNPG